MLSVVRMSKEINIDTALLRRYNARRRWTLLRTVMTLIKLVRPAATTGAANTDNLEFEKLVIKHIKKTRLKKCFRKKKK